MPAGRLLAVALAVTTAVQESHRRLAAVPATSALLELRSRPPALRPGLIPRERLVRRLAEARRRPVALLRAPAGYGKTTLLHEWTACDPRPCAWATLSAEDNDPLTLVSVVALAFEAVDPIGWEVFDALSSGRPDADEVALRRLARAISRKEDPFVLVLDDLHVLRTRPARAVVRALRAALPPGAQLALASRSPAELPIGRLRAQGDSIEVGADDLAMTRSEAAALLAAAGLEAGAEDLSALIRRTGGWPAALHLAALSLAGEGSAAVEAFAGDDRFVSEYVRQELLDEVSPSQLEFMMGTSVLEQLTAPLCDAVLKRDDSAGVLETLAQANVPLVALDRSGTGFRYNALFADVLREELLRREPERETCLNRRASAWLEKQGDLNAAVRHSIQAGDVPRTARLLWSAAPAAVGQGQGEAIAGPLRRLGDENLVDNPLLGLVAAGCSLLAGNFYEAERWTTVAASGHDVAEGGLALMQAGIGRAGVQRMGADASRAHALLEESSAWRPLARFFEGAALHLGGHGDSARVLLEEGAHRAAVCAPLIQALCLAQLALLADDDGDIARASSLAARARAQIERFNLEDNPAATLVIAVWCELGAPRREASAMEREIGLGRSLLGSLIDPSPWYDAECRIVLSRAVLRASGPAAAGELLAPALTAFGPGAEAPVLARWRTEMQQRVEVASGSLAATDWSLTSAELRVLRYLPSHLSFREIAERLYVSQNTVKTHARSIYRKLDVSSRGMAVDLARGAGLVEPAVSG
jgi:LuxR family transcriptional regulator, maltose regulon positive regulatory protein